MAIDTRLTHLLCGSPVDYLCIHVGYRIPGRGGSRRVRPDAPHDDTILALMASYSASVMSFASRSFLASCRRRTASLSAVALAAAGPDITWIPPDRARNSSSS